MNPGRPDESLNGLLVRNIEALDARRRREIAAASLQDRLADRITAFTGSMAFVYLHVLFYGMWVLLNLGLVPGLPPFDPSFVLLAMEASVEAIFLSTFVLISQNRSAADADRRAELDLHISLLTEHELTKLTEVVTAIAERLDLHQAINPDVEEVKQHVQPEAVLDAIDSRQKNNREQ